MQTEYPIQRHFNQFICIEANESLWLEILHLVLSICLRDTKAPIRFTRGLDGILTEFNLLHFKLARQMYEMKSIQWKCCHEIRLISKWCFQKWTTHTKKNVNTIRTRSTTFQVAITFQNGATDSILNWITCERCFCNGLIYVLSSLILNSLVWMYRNSIKPFAKTKSVQ